MKTDLDVLAVATRLVEEMGEDAPRASKVRHVELTAANNIPAARFWREVTRICEAILATHRPPPAKGTRQQQQRPAELA